MPDPILYPVKVFADYCAGGARTYQFVQDTADNETFADFCTRATNEFRNNVAAVCDGSCTLVTDIGGALKVHFRFCHLTATVGYDVVQGDGESESAFRARAVQEFRDNVLPQADSSCSL